MLLPLATSGPAAALISRVPATTHFYSNWSLDSGRTEKKSRQHGHLDPQSKYGHSHALRVRAGRDKEAEVEVSPDTDCQRRVSSA